MAKNKQPANNNKRINVEVDYDKLADAIVRAQERANHESSIVSKTLSFMTGSFLRFLSVVGMLIGACLLIGIVYYAITEYWQRSKRIYKTADTYDEELALTNKASSKFGSQAAIDAFVKTNLALKQGGFYDPMAQESNTVCGTYASDFDVAVRNFVKGTGAATWMEAVGGMQDSLNESIQRAFG